MNIFWLDNDPRTCAAYHCDKHVVRMIVEYALILSTVVHQSGAADGVELYEITHQNHPCTKWARENLSNYRALLDLALACCEEYTERYGKVFKTERILRGLPRTIPLPVGELTPVLQVMPDEFKIPGDPVAAYRNLYIQDKVRFAKWKTQPPHWWPYES